MKMQRVFDLSKKTLLTTITVILLGFAGSVMADTYIVTDTTDNGGVCSAGGPCSLRQAINAANAHANALNPSSVADEIHFNIPASTDPGCNSVTGICSIKPAVALPAITEAVILDGYTQGAAMPATASTPAKILIDIDGSNTAIGTNGAPNDNARGFLLLNHEGSVIRGFAIHSFRALRCSAFGVPSSACNATDFVTQNGVPNAQGSVPASGLAIRIREGGHHTIEGNYIGIDAKGNAVDPSNSLISLGNEYTGIQMEASNYNMIGGSTPSARNVIANNGTLILAGPNRGQGPLGFGVLGTSVTISAVVVPSQFNTVQGNYIGTDTTGMTRLGTFYNTVTAARCFAPSSTCRPEHRLGVLMATNSAQNVIKDNLVSGNAVGIELFNGANHNSIIGNKVGMTAAGGPLGNVAQGIFIFSNANDNIVDSNVVANTGVNPAIGLNANASAIMIQGTSATAPANRNQITNNIIGTDMTGTDVGLGNNRGILIGTNDISASDNKIIGNTVAYSAISGITLMPSATGTGTNLINNSILSNSIYGNAFMGIDLVPLTGPSLNDSPFNLDADTGSNNLQNFPVLDPTRSFANPALVQVEGDLDSAANSNYLIQVFSNDTAVCLQLTTTPPVGYAPSPGCTVDAGFTTAFLSGQGHVLIGEIQVLTDDSGHVHFRFPAKLNSPIGSIITATATLLQAMPDGSYVPEDTSEFSQAIDVTKKGSANAYTHANGAAGGDNDNSDNGGAE